MKVDRSVLMFWRNLLLPSTGLKSKPSKEASSRALSLVLPICLVALTLKMKAAYCSEISKLLPDHMMSYPIRMAMRTSIFQIVSWN
jgi:hypothetical protein